MKSAVLMHINFDGRDQSSYQSVSYDVRDANGRTIATKEFATGDPSRDWSCAMHEALVLGLPVLRAQCCDGFVATWPDFAWGTNPGKKLLLLRRGGAARSDRTGAEPSFATACH